MSLGPTRQLLTTGKRLLQLSQQLQQSTNLTGLASVYAGLTVDPLTRLEHQLQGIPIGDNEVSETLREPTVGSTFGSWGPEFIQSTALSVKPGFDLSSSIKPSSSAAPSLSSTLEPVSFSQANQLERALSPVTNGHRRIDDQTVADQSSSLPTSADLTTSATFQASTPASQILGEDRLSSFHPASSDSNGSSTNLQSAPSAAPIPQSSLATIPNAQSLAQTENFQVISSPASLPSGQAASPLRMIQGSNKLASMLKTQLAPLPTASDNPSSPEPSSSPDISFPSIPAPAPAQAAPLDTTENLDDYSPITAHPQPINSPQIHSPPQTLDPLALDTLVDAVAERLEFDRLRLYGTSSL